MKQELWKLALLGTLAVSAVSAQVPKAQAYVFQAVGGTAYNRWATPLGGTGGGGEGIFWKGLGAGAEIVAYYPYEYVRGVIGVANVSATYHFNAGKPGTKWDPFVVGGYSLFFRSSSLSGVHAGGGLTYWFHRRIGARVEFRDQRTVTEGLSFPAVRFGVSFR
ncbi:MAG: hypothetical protein JST93_23620 [Acidobacteria bacterium]|nr:hypothetical protein [Acidobacteriota bacterium]